MLKSPLTIILTAGSFLNYWASVYKEEDAGAIRAGAKQMIKTVSELANKDPGAAMRASDTLRITGS